MCFISLNAMITFAESCFSDSLCDVLKGIYSQNVGESRIGTQNTNDRSLALAILDFPWSFQQSQCPRRKRNNASRMVFPKKSMQVYSYFS